MIQLSREQAQVAAAALAPRVQALRDLLAHPMLQLPDGIVAWDHVPKQLDLHHSALLALQNIGAGQ